MPARVGLAKRVYTAVTESVVIKVKTPMQKNLWLRSAKADSLGFGCGRSAYSKTDWLNSLYTAHNSFSALAAQMRCGYHGYVYDISADFANRIHKFVAFYYGANSFIYFFVSYNIFLARLVRYVKIRSFGTPPFGVAIYPLVLGTRAKRQNIPRLCLMCPNRKYAHSPFPYAP